MGHNPKQMERYLLKGAEFSFKLTIGLLELTALMLPKFGFASAGRAKYDAETGGGGVTFLPAATAAAAAALIVENSGLGLPRWYVFMIFCPFE